MVFLMKKMMLEKVLMIFGFMLIYKIMIFDKNTFKVNHNLFIFNYIDCEKMDF